MTQRRLSKLQLGELELGLTPRDRAILEAIRTFRYMKTDQIRRLFFPQVTNSLQASKTAALKKMNHFRAQGLVDHLPRQYNKQKYGAQMLIWHLTEAGQRLLDLHRFQTPFRRLKKQRCAVERRLRIRLHKAYTGDY